MLPHPTYVTTMPCETLSCKWRGYAIAACKAEGCGVRFEREAAEDRAARDARDRASAEGLSPDKMQSERTK